MTVTGTVTKVIRRTTPHGSVYITTDIAREAGTVRLKYLSSHNRLVVKGQHVTIDGMPMMGSTRTNIGGVRITVHDTASAS
jgi:hypothetical protein